MMFHVRELYTYRDEADNVKGGCNDLGIMPKTQVQLMLKGFVYDEGMGIWHSEHWDRGFIIEEVME